MKKYKFTVSDYHRSPSDDNVGVFRNGQRILFGYEKDDGVCDYLFKFIIALDSDDVMERLDPKHYEIVEFYAKCDLKDYTKTYKLPDWMLDEGEDNSRTSLDEIKIINKFNKQEFKDCEERIIRKIEAVEPDPVMYTATDWHKGDEFLQFTEESAYCWAGPFKQGGVLGACMSIKTDEEFKLPILNVKEDWWYYHCSYEHQNELDQKHGGDNGIYKLSKEEMSKLFDTFTVKQQHHIYKNFLKYHAEKESIQSLLPNRIYLAGSDDCSYSKWFANKEEVEEEVKYLRIMQPLDMGRDIYKRGYIFTN